MSESESLLRAQARFLEVAEPVYLTISSGERRIAKQRHITRLKKKAKSLKVDDVDAYVEEQMRDYPESDQKLVRTNSAEVRAKKQQKSKKPKKVSAKLKADAEVISLEDDEPIPSFEVQDGVRVYHDGGDMPPATEDPNKRDGITVGNIIERERPPDLVGDRPPRTLSDLYARWPIAQDSQFFLRIERTKPKRYQGLDVSGFVGEIRGQAISEAEIQRRYGGTEYKVQLYGPDPRMREDAEGNVVVKALTDPITINVPVYPPNLSAMPTQEPTNMNASPFGLPMMAPPTSTGDAAIHKANASFFSDVIKLQREDERRRDSENSKANMNLLSYMESSQKSQLEAARKETERLERELKATLEKERAERAAEREELRQQIEKEKAAQAQVAEHVTKAKDEGTSTLVKFMEKLGPDKEAEVRRLTEYYKEQLEVLRNAHADQIKSMRERAEADLRRAEERVREGESNYRLLLEQERTQSRTMLDAERSQWSQRERDLRDQMKEQTEAERTMAAQRVSDMKERHEAELRQMEKGHERELRSIREALDTKLSVSETTHNMTAQQMRERYEDLKEQMERIREEAEEAKDLTAQLEKAEKQAQLLGFEKKDANEPKGPWERFAATAGAGLAQALSSANEWLPQVMAQRQEQQARAALQAPQQQRQRAAQAAQAAQQQQQRQAPVQRRTRGAQWAAEGVHVPRPRTEPMGFPVESANQPKREPEVQVANPAEVEKKVTEAPDGPVAEKQQNGAAELAIQLPEKFQQHFQPEAVVGFLSEAEKAMAMQVDPAGFAALMVGRFREGATTLSQQFTYEEAVEAVQAIPGTETSPLLRRDGKKWLEKLWKELALQLKSTSSDVAVVQQ